MQHLNRYSWWLSRRRNFHKASFLFQTFPRCKKASRKPALSLENKNLLFPKSDPHLLINPTKSYFLCIGFHQRLSWLISFRFNLYRSNKHLQILASYFGLYYFHFFFFFSFSTSHLFQICSYLFFPLFSRIKAQYSRIMSMKFFLISILTACYKNPFDRFWEILRSRLLAHLGWWKFLFLRGLQWALSGQ